jgi:RNA recognition motif-containing protein
VIADKVTKKSRGYGFVKFHHVEDAKKAVQAMNGFALENKHLKVSFKTPPAASYSNLMSSSFERRVADFALCSSGDEAPSADDV